MIADNSIKMSLGSKYSKELRKFQDFPDHARLRGEQRFLLLREFEDCYSVKERERLGNKFRIHAARKRFCKEKRISISTFIRWKNSEDRHGPLGLIPLYRLDTIKDNQVLFCPTDQLLKENRNSRFLTQIIRFDINKPYDLVRIIKNLIETRSGLSEPKKQIILSPFNFILSYSKSHFFKPINLHLEPKEIEQLKLYKFRNHRNHWAKATALLMAFEKYCLFEISVAVGRAPNSILRWFGLYRKKGLKFIETKIAEDRRKKMWEERTTRVIDILHSPPTTYGINRTSWTYDTILQVYQKKYNENLPKGSLKRVVKETNYTWRHARKVLTSSDPDYKEKVKVVLSALRRTKEEEAFFFIDEMGPYQVKKYGGKTLIEKGNTNTVPIKQESRGKIQAIAALEAFSNQLTWQFIESKNATAIIKLLEMLRTKYSEKRRLIITWDAIITHNSSAVKEWVKINNLDVSKGKSGPKFKIVPLPSKSQFLNVIESVFSGMKRAVIHNSDYSSKEEMEQAVNRHFVERNEFYRKNPKRAGHKIWDKEAFKTENLQGGLFRKM